MTDTATITPEVRAAIDAVIAASGRQVGSCWVGIDNGMTSNCAGTVANIGQRHDLCEGWINPLCWRQECMCPCHDAHRPTHHQARAITAQLVADYDRQRIADPVLTRLADDLERAGGDVHADKVRRWQAGLATATPDPRALPDLLHGMRAPQHIRPLIEQDAAYLADQMAARGLA